MDKRRFYFIVTVRHHIYWIAGGVIGLVAGALIPINMTGIDFAMTALFEQWKIHSKHLPAILGFGVSILAIRIFGVDNFLLPTLVTTSLVLLAMRRKLDVKL